LHQFGIAEARAERIADGSTIARAKEKNLDTSAALRTLDAFPLFEALGDAIITGPTGNNMRDVRVLMAY
jgi:hydroxypyruvate reductase